MFLNKLKLHFNWNVLNNLGDIVKLPLLRKLPPKRVGQIWRTHYSQRSDRLGECLDKLQFERLIRNGSVCRFFALPLRRDISSFITFFVGFLSNNIVFLTPLNNYLHNSNSNSTNNNLAYEPFILIKFYDELKESHGLVLAKVDINNSNSYLSNNNNNKLINKDNNKDNYRENKLIINKKEALNLFENVLLFYSDFNRFHWVEQFNQRPREFKFEHFLKNNNDLFHIY